MLCSALQTTFKGRVFMTHATKVIYRLMLSDYVKVSKVSVEDMLFDEQDIIRSMDKIEVGSLFTLLSCLSLADVNGTNVNDFSPFLFSIPSRVLVADKMIIGNDWLMKQMEHIFKRYNHNKLGY